MGRHNTIAGRMAESSAARGRLFTKLAREIMVAARTGSDVNSNSALRAAVSKAKDNSMPKENIERAIKKGAGELKGSQFEEILYEGYGPSGCAVLVEVLTDNRNRTLPEIKKIFQKNGGALGEIGTVAWMFKRQGVLIVNTEHNSEDKVMEIALESGANDVVHEGHFMTIYTDVSNFSVVREAFLAQDIPFEKTGLEYIPENTVPLSEADEMVANELVEKLEEHDDVQNVSCNF